MLYARLHFDSVITEGNFADQNSHGISLITSKLEIHNSYISNANSTINVTLEE